MKETEKETKKIIPSEKWREKHEGRMRNVGVVRGGKVKVDEGEKGKERERGGTEVIEEERKPTPGEDAKSGRNGLGEGWEW